MFFRVANLGRLRHGFLRIWPRFGGVPRRACAMALQISVRDRDEQPLVLLTDFLSSPL